MVSVYFLSCKDKAERQSQRGQSKLPGKPQKPLRVYDFSPISCSDPHVHSSQKQLRSSVWGISQLLRTARFVCSVPQLLNRQTDRH